MEIIEVAISLSHAKYEINKKVVNMEKIIKVYSCLCSLERFEINGIRADYEDFGSKYDCDEDGADEYCCGNMRFFPKLPTNEILKKYNISVDEYSEIAEELEDKLSFGSCGLCS